MDDLSKMSVEGIIREAACGRVSEVIAELARRLAEAEARAEKHFVDKLGEKAVRMVMESNVDIWKARAEAAEAVVAKLMPKVVNLCSHFGPDPESVRDGSHHDAWIADLWEDAEVALTTRQQATAEPSPTPAPGSDATTSDGRFISGPGYGGERM